MCELQKHHTRRSCIRPKFCLGETGNGRVAFLNWVTRYLLLEGDQKMRRKLQVQPLEGIRLSTAAFNVIPMKLPLYYLASEKVNTHHTSLLSIVISLYKNRETLIRELRYALQARIYRVGPVTSRLSKTYH